MNKFINTSIISTVLILLLSGCVNQPLKVNEIKKLPTNINTLALLNSNRFDSQLKDALKDNGFNVKVAPSMQSRKVFTASGEVVYNEASSRYGILHHGVKRANGNCLITTAEAFKKYNLELVDLTTGDTVLDLSMGGWIGTCHSPEQDYILFSMSKKLQEIINPKKTSFTDIKKDSSRDLKKIDIKVLAENKEGYYKKNGVFLDGRYRIIDNDLKDSYGVVEFKSGLIQEINNYNLQNELTEKLKFKDNILYEKLSFYRSGSLKGIIPITNKMKDGLVKYYYNTGELNFEIKYSLDRIIEGYIYQQNGKKSKMTEAHFYNYKLK